MAFDTVITGTTYFLQSLVDSSKFLCVTVLDSEFSYVNATST